MLRAHNIIAAKTSPPIAKKGVSMPLGRLVACGLLAFLSLPAQTITGSISGTVSDQSSLPVQAATVTLANQATGAQREAQTDDRANFLFSGLPPGQYTLSVRASGFKTVER